MSTVVETPAETPSLPNLFHRAKDRFEHAMLYVGGITDLGVQTIREIVRGPVETKLLIAQFEEIGVRSLSIVGITSLFIGMVLALQTAYSLDQFGVKMFI